MNKKQLANSSISARFDIDVSKALEQYFEKYDNIESAYYLIDQFLRKIYNSSVNIYLPDKVVSNYVFIKEVILSRVSKLKDQITKDHYVKELRDFFMINHEFIKIAEMQWFLINAGVLIEFLVLSENLDLSLRKWLANYSIYPEDWVICRHTMSEKGRKRLKEIGFSVPFDHWDKEYVIDALVAISEILKKVKDIKGVFTEDSWLYDPGIHNIASDGKPYVAFTFFNDVKLKGHVFYRGIATKNNAFKKHYLFATRNARRKMLADNREFVPKVYSAIYPRDELLRNVKNMR